MAAKKGKVVYSRKKSSDKKSTGNGRKKKSKPNKSGISGWIKLAGRREVPGRPVIYATTPEFLDHFGLSSRRDLPGIDELKASGLLDPVDEAFEEAMSKDEEANEEATDAVENHADVPEFGEETADSAGPDVSDLDEQNGQSEI